MERTNTPDTVVISHITKFKSIPTPAFQNKNGRPSGPFYLAMGRLKPGECFEVHTKDGKKQISALRSSMQAFMKSRGVKITSRRLGENHFAFYRVG